MVPALFRNMNAPAIIVTESQGMTLSRCIKVKPKQRDHQEEPNIPCNYKKEQGKRQLHQEVWTLQQKKQKSGA